jgi:general secretion pathway protein F
MRMLGGGQAAKNKNSIAAGIEKEISMGKSFSSALAIMLPDVTAVELASVQISEKTGKLSDTLLSLANQLESQVELRAKLGSMLVYPMFLMALVPLVLVFVAMVLVPNIAPLFENSGKPMPMLLAFFVEVSKLLQNHPIQVLGILALVSIGATLAFQNSGIKRRLNNILLALPILASLRKQQQQQAFCQGMGTLLANGATLQDALSAIAIGHTQSNISYVQDDVSEGIKLSSALIDRKILDIESAQVIAVGEESNQMPLMFFHIAATIQKNYAARLERLMTLLVPILTLLIGLIVGGVMVSVMSALLAVNEVPL